MKILYVTMSDITVKELEVAKEDGYTDVHDYWGPEDWTEYPIDEYINKIKNETIEGVL